MTTSTKQFSKWSLEWIEFHRSKVKLSTYKMYLFKVQKLNEFFGTQNISEISTMDIQKYLNYLAQDKKLSASTVKKYRITLTNIFNYAINNCEIDKNPCSLSDIPKTIEKPPRRALTESEIKTVYQYSKNNLKYIYPVVLLYTGLRRSECLALKWEDFDFKNKRIHIYKVVLFDRSIPFVEYKLKNGSKERYIPLPTALEKLLKKVKQSTGWLFTDENNSLLTESKVDMQWRDFLKNTHLKITQHMTRHTYATMLYYAGVDVKTAQQFLGHKHITTLLDIYTHLDNENLKMAAQKFDKYLIGKIQGT